MKNEIDLAGILESVLFVRGEPIETKRLAEVADSSEEEIIHTLGELEDRYKKAGGLALVKKDGAWQLVSNPVYAPYVEALVKNEFGEELSKAALETIAIVAYKGPLTRAEIEYIRGVNSSFTVRALLMRGLIERIDNPKDARSYLYRVSMDFLKYLGISRIEDLPEYEALRQSFPEESSQTS